MAEQSNGNGKITAAGAAAGSEEASGPQLIVQRIYLKDCSFESPSTPRVFAGEWSPQMQLNISAASTPIGDDHYEVVLTVTVEAKKDDVTAFLCEIQQAGLFMIRGFSTEDHRRVVNASCPNVIFPYAREAICDLVTKGGFPQLLLQPVNFDTLYQRHTAEQRDRDTGGSPAA
jgi:preprotein translocase subunit SecB